MWLPKVGNKETVSSIWITPSLALLITHSEESWLSSGEGPSRKAYMAKS